MRFARLSTATAVLLMHLTNTHAQPISAWLPPSEQVASVLRASPMIQAAQARQEAQRQRADGVEVGSGEWTMRVNQQQRRVRDPMERFQETTVSMERPIRLWGKKALDASLAQQDRDVARVSFADALHEASRQLLNIWFSVLRARIEVSSAERELQLARELDRQARVRLGQGDVSRLDAGLAQAELQRSEAAARLAQGNLMHSTAQLQRLYPGLPAPAWPSGDPGLPEPLKETLGAAMQDFLARHHELMLLRMESQRQQQWAQRVSRDRMPDATVGVFVTRERGGSEQLVGVSVSMPLSGAYRETHARAALADAQMLEQRVRNLERDLSAQFESRWRQLEQQQLAYSALQSAAQVQKLAAAKSLSAYSMGEHTMTELILNRRLANEQQLASNRLLLDVLLNRALIELDAHRLWDLDD